MADNVSVKDSAGSAKTFRTTDTASVHTPHQIVDTLAAGGSVDIGAVADAAVSTDATGSVNAHLRGLVKISNERLPAALGQGTMSQSLSVVIASNQSALALGAGSAAIGGVKLNGPQYAVTQTLGSSANASSTPLDVTTAPANPANAVMIDDLIVSAAVDMVLTFRETSGANLLIVHYKTAQGAVSLSPRTWLRASVNKKIEVLTSITGQIYTWASWHEQ